MHASLVVALHGRSLILASVGKRLEANHRLRVVTLEGSAPESALASLAPDVVLVDLDAIDVGSAVALLDDQPDMLLVGLEASGARLLVLAGRQARVLSTEDLVLLIERRAEPMPQRA